MFGLLYESDEWSDHKLAAELEAQGCPTEMIDLAQEDGEQALARALDCELLVSRIFASAVFRGHAVAHERMARLIPAAEQRGILLVNCGRAHFFEIDKRAAAEELRRAGIDVPQVQALGTPGELDPETLRYPCVIKPNCGGRTTCTTIAHAADEAREFLRTAPDIALIAEDYIAPEQGYITRVEVVAGAPELVVKRSIAANGLSAYHLGSTYELYPSYPQPVREATVRAAQTLGILFGSFDVIENGGRAWVIDANSVSNVSEDNTEMFQFDLMRAHAEGIARMWRAGQLTA